MDKAKEDYLSEIYRLQHRKNSSVGVSEISEVLKISKPSVSAMVRTLAEMGLVEFEPYKGISLTQKGTKEARKVLRKHHILEVFYTKVLKIKRNFHQDAHKIEHDISDEATEQIDSLLHRPEISPKGKPIPKSDSKVYVLSNLPEGKEGRILFSSINDESMLKRLNALGLLPDSFVKVTRKVPRGPIMLNIKGSEIALGKDITSKIFVETCKD